MVRTADVDALERALLDLDQVTARRLINDAGSGSLSTATIDSLVVPALVRVGESWERGDVALSQVYMSGRICEHVIMSALASASVDLRIDQPRISVGVLGDAHVLGKQIVLQMLRSAGYRVTDIGARLTNADVVDAVQREGTEVLVLSVLMLRSALQVATLRERLDEAGLHPTIVVGGAPFRFDADLADEVGADYVGTSASDILTILTRIEQGR